MSRTVPLRDEDIETRHHGGSATAEPRLGDADDTDATDDADTSDDADDADDADTSDEADVDGTDR